MLLEGNRDQVAAILGAMRCVTTADGALPLSDTDRTTLESANRIMFRGLTIDDVTDLDLPSGGQLAELLPDSAAREHAVAFCTIAAFVDGVVDSRRLNVVLGYARDLGVRTAYVHELTDIATGHLRMAAAEMLRRNISSIVNHDWSGTDEQAWFMPYREAPDSALEKRYEALAEYAEGSLGRSFYEHYKLNGFLFPGNPEAFNEAFVTPHDTVHLLSGYDTSFQGELLVSTFTAGMHKREAMAGHILPVILQWHLGIKLVDVGIAHKGALDPAKFWTAWERGAETAGDPFGPGWDFWAEAERPLAELTAAYGVPPLPPAMAAVGDGLTAAFKHNTGA